MMPYKHVTMPTDEYVGKRIAMQRQLHHVSQSKLGEALDLTFQQIQKYEKGTNRVSASKLQAMANFFNVPVGFFFEGGPNAKVKQQQSAEGPFVSLLSTRTGVRLCTAFQRINSPALRESVVELVETMSRKL